MPTKKQQYYARRDKGRTPEDAANRTRLSRGAAWRYEVDYQAGLKAQRAAELAAARADQKVRAQAEKAEGIARAKRQAEADAFNAQARAASKAYLEAHPDPPPAIGAPVSEYGFVEPQAFQDSSGLSAEHLHGLAENNPGEKVEPGNWEYNSKGECVFVSDSDRIDRDFREREDAKLRAELATDPHRYYFLERYGMLP